MNNNDDDELKIKLGCLHGMEVYSVRFLSPPPTPYPLPAELPKKVIYRKNLDFPRNHLELNMGV